MFSKRFVCIALGILASLSFSGCGGRSKAVTTTAPTPLPVSVTVTAASATVDATNSITLSAVVTNDKNAAGVTWAVTGGGALSASTTSGTTYTAPAASAAALSITVTATSVADTAKSGTATITVPAGPAITSASLSAATVGTAYSVALAGGGGIGPYTWSLASGTLPAGLSLSPSGVVSGVPMAAGAGTANLTFKMTDSGKATALSTTAPLALTVNPAPAITFPSATLPVGTRNTAYAASVAGTGGAGTLTHSIVSGALPAGLTMAASGAIAGTPTEAVNSLITVKAADAFGDSASDIFSLVVNYLPITITTTTLPEGIVGTNYTATALTATGGSGLGYTWALTSGSTLPAGLSLSSGGVLSGKPTAAGTTSVSVTVSDSVSDKATATLSIVVDEPGLTISTPKNQHAYIGSAYSLTMTATGGSGNGYTWSLASGSALPAGFNLSAAGLLSGNPTTILTTSFTVSVTDSASGTASATFSLNVATGVTINTLPTLPAAIAGGNYYTTLAAIGGSGTGYNWTKPSASTLPDGLSILASGVLRGKPTTPGDYTFSLTVTDSASNTATATFTLSIGNGVKITTPDSLPAGYVGVNYAQPLAATGGTGTGYTWSVTSGIASLNAVNLNVSSAGVISGKPLASGTATFTVQVTDSFADAATASFTITVSVLTTPTLPAANPASLPSATINQPYSGTITAIGGSAPFTWKINGATLPPDGISAISLGNALSVTNNGSAILSVSGTPNAMGPIDFTAQITDSVSAASSVVGYAVNVNSAGSQVAGRISLTNNCGNVTLPAISVNIDTNPVKTVTTDSNGDYTFSGVPDGTYTISPSIVGPSSVFYPATLSSVAVNGGDVTGENFIVSLGYSVSGTVSYSGTQPGPIYVSLNQNSCGNNALGVNIPVPGPFTIRGVPLGTYTLSAWKDVQGFGSLNKSDPSGTNASVPVSNANVTGASVTMTDPATYTLGPGPKINSISPADNGVTINFEPLTGAAPGGGQMEWATSYTVQWSTDSNFISPAPASYVFNAGAANGTGVLLLNNGIAGLTTTFTNGNAYFFRVRGETASGSSTWTSPAAAVTIGAPAEPNTVTGSVTFTGTANGPLYVGLFDMSTGIAYTQKILSPVSPQPFTIQVPTGTSYFFFGELDQNNDGMMDTGDINNTRNNNSSPIAISGNATMDLTLPAVDSKATVTTQHYIQTSQSGNSEGYNLNFEVSEGTKLPISVTLTSGPNVFKPIDTGKCLDCGNNKFRYYVGIAGSVPNVGDSYDFDVTYGDGSHGTVTATVSAVLSDFATALTPAGAGAGTTPTFTWTYPANAGSYLYQFYLSGNSGTIWQIPGNNSKQNGFSNSVTSIVWGTDPTGDSSNQPSVPGLTGGATYFWQIRAQDANGNSTQTQVQILP